MLRALVVAEGYVVAQTTERRSSNPQVEDVARDDVASRSQPRRIGFQSNRTLHDGPWC
jgi:hypothetical protein